MNGRTSEKQLNHQLEKSKKRASNKTDFYNKAIILCQDYLCKLKKRVIGTGFRSVEEEIHCFKVEKQVALHNLVFYSEIKSFEAYFPLGNKEVQRNFIETKQKEINLFFRNHADFIQYIEQGLNNLDKFYFTRSFSNEFQTAYSVSYYRDPDFSTSHDLLLATLKSNKRMMEYLEERLLGLEHPSFQVIPKSKLKWTSSKTALTELTYALYHGGAVNNGNTDIIEIAQALQNTFNFPIGDVYRTYIEIRSRKKGRTKFLDELSTSLISGMDRLDE